MPLANDVKNSVKNDVRAAQKLWLPWWAVVCLFVVGMPIPWLFGRHGRLDLVLPTWNGMLVLACAIAIKWALRRHWWFWVAMTMLAALQVALILCVPWTTKWVPALFIAVIDSAELIAMLAMITVVAKIMDGSNAPAERG